MSSVEVLVLRHSFLRVRRTFVPPTSPMTATTSSGRFLYSSELAADVLLSSTAGYCEPLEKKPMHARVAKATVAPATALATPKVSF